MWKMSSVRVSKGSPTLERVDARLTDHSKPPVRRNLFGSVDHDEFKRDSTEQLQEMEKASADTWNFDFSANKPLSSGKYEWVEVDGKDLPDFYTRPPHKRATSSGTVDHNGNHDYSSPTASPESGEGHSDDTKNCRESHTATRKRPASPESSRQSKRSHTSPGEEHSADLTHSEQTPSKSDPRT
ncbi:cyclin-dependent kinase inhibitor 1Ba [Chanos chanos]|uniref:Cyclin-dependent kinase inhibitor 1B n=1 Tax=Chanos chanos TaxID=29144 RepID=A0A6J2W6L7_CHACN|nr:cyclin-dependent kinase inhibitor 1B-like [Chanos chanos]